MYGTVSTEVSCAGLLALCPHLQRKRLRCNIAVYIACTLSPAGSKRSKDVIPHCQAKRRGCSTLGYSVIQMPRKALQTVSASC